MAIIEAQADETMGEVALDTRLATIYVRCYHGSNLLTGIAWGLAISAAVFWGPVAMTLILRR